MMKMNEQIDKANYVKDVKLTGLQEASAQKQIDTLRA